MGLEGILELLWWLAAASATLGMLLGIAGGVALATDPATPEAAPRPQRVTRRKRRFVTQELSSSAA